MGEELDRVIARLREDASFARVTVSRRGDNLMSWVPPLSSSEIRAAVRAAAEAQQLEAKPKTAPPMTRAEREHEAYRERTANELRARDARDRAEIQKKRDARRLVWQRRGCRFLGRHHWDGCICVVCEVKRDQDHDWRGCRCGRCRATRDVDHAFDGCQCRVCSAKRDQDHIWDGCTCKRCRSSRDQEHDWSGCRCRRCYKVRDEEHVWEDDTLANKYRNASWERDIYYAKCKVCGRQESKHLYANSVCPRCGNPFMVGDVVSCKMCRTRFHSHCAGDRRNCPKCGVSWLPRRY